MIISYFLFIVSTAIFCYYNIDEIESIEKSDTYMNLFYFHFEAMILVQLLCTCFYACDNMNIAILLGLGIFIFNNIMLLLSYLIKEKIELKDGIYEYNEPQNLVNIYLNIIYLAINCISFVKIILTKHKSKL